MQADIKGLEEILKYEFKDKTLPESALAHSSYANERKINKIQNYERLEFLGDAVLELTVSEFLFENYPDKKEGEMTRTRAALVCEPTLAGCARQIGLDKLILLGKGEESTGGRDRDSILCDVFEAVAGALYLDGGFEAAKAYIKAFLLKDWNDKVLFVDSKTILQEKAQKKGLRVSYRTCSEEGPANDKIYEEELLIGDIVRASAKGKSKKAAQQQAAYEFLIKEKQGTECI